MMQAGPRLILRSGIVGHNAFRTGLSAVDEFPRAAWGRLFARRWRQADLELMHYQDPAGYRPLREAIAA